jgi:hypothetical protein
MSVGAPMMLTECCFTARSLTRLRQLAKQVHCVVAEATRTLDDARIGRHAAPAIGRQPLLARTRLRRGLMRINRHDGVS